MSVIVLASFAGAPGTTTAATGLAVHWPRPVVLFEADTASASSIMPGFLRSNLRPQDGGIEKIAMASAHSVLRREDVFDPTLHLSVAVHELPPIPAMPLPSLPAEHRLWIVPGFVHLNIVDGVRGLWGQLPNLLRSISEDGIDVIVDLGRINPDDARLAILDTADRVIICAHSTMVDLNRLYRRLELPDLSARVDVVNRGSRYALLLNEGPSEQLTPRDFAQHILPVVGALPHDPVGAATFSHGRPDPKPGRNRYRTAIRKLAGEIGATAARDGLDRKAAV